jgi:hypothetical protein
VMLAMSGTEMVVRIASMPLMSTVRSRANEARRLLPKS